MKNYKNLHIMNNEKFIHPYIKFINENFNEKEHKFLIIDGLEEKEPYRERNVERYISKKKNYNNKIASRIMTLLILPILYIKLFCRCRKSEKLFFHGLFDARIIVFLYLFPSFLKKSYWCIWGGDLYCYRNRDKNPSLLKRLYYHMDSKVKGNFKGYITDTFGDYQLTKIFYDSNGNFHENFLYPSNLYENINIKNISNKTLNIQIGNSGDPSNNHFAILEKLKKFNYKDIKLYCILSYGGNEKYKKELIEQGKIIFGNKFIPILDFMKYDEYMKFLSKIDIAIFAHDRQQACGNIISLLGMKKTVFIKSDVTTYQQYQRLGLNIKDFYDLTELKEFSLDILEKNKEIIKNYFSEENLIKMWKNVFYD